MGRVHLVTVREGAGATPPLFSMSKKVVSYDPLAQATTWWDYDPHTNESLIWTEQPVDQLVDFNKKLSNEAGKTFDKKHPLGTKVATIPPLIWANWIRTGKYKDKAFVKRWLNDPDNRFFRTHEARL